MTRYDRRRRRRGQSSLSTPPDGEESLERYGQAADARAATKAAREKGAARGMLCFFIPELIPRSRLGRGLVCERSTAPRTKSLWFVYGRILGNKERLAVRMQVLACAVARFCDRHRTQRSSQGAGRLVRAKQPRACDASK